MKLLHVQLPRAIRVAVVEGLPQGVHHSGLSGAVGSVGSRRLRWVEEDGAPRQMSGAKTVTLQTWGRPLVRFWVDALNLDEPALGGADEVGLSLMVKTPREDRRPAQTS